MAGYTSTPSKDLIRRFINKPIIAAFASNLGSKLSYFGCPGIEGLDLLEWQDHLKEIVAVDENLPNLEQLTIKMLGIAPQLQVFEAHGAIEKLILDGRRDTGGKRLGSRWDPEAHTWRWNYSLINLDVFRIFLAGPSTVVGTRAAAYYNRTEAIKRLFVLQRGHSFVLLITVPLWSSNPTSIERIAHDLSSYLSAQCSQTPQLIADVIDFRLNQNAGKLPSELLTAAMPLMLAQFGAQESFRLKDFQIIKYLGSNKARMFHLACVCEAIDDALPVQMDLRAALGAPTYTIRSSQDSVLLLPDEIQSPLLDPPDLISIADDLI